MITGTILTILGVFVIANILNMSDKLNNRHTISFKETLDLTNLPIITFVNNDVKLNFLLDTGSDMNHINDSCLKDLKYEEAEGVLNVEGFEGNKSVHSLCNIDITYKDKVFTDTFTRANLDKAFGNIKNATGATIHGILGVKFFLKYKYIIDFESLKVTQQWIK